MTRHALIWCSEHADLDYRRAMVDSFRRPGEEWEVLSPADPDFRRRARGHAGYVLSGSEKSVAHDVDTPFVATLLDFLRDTHAEDRSAVVGICFGAQAIAAALGGEVGRNPRGGFRLGIDVLTWQPGLDTGRWPEAVEPVTLIESHGECIRRLPPATALLASSATVPHEVFLVGDRFLGIQGHPETDLAMMRSLFMPVHRDLFSADAWREVERELERPLQPTPILGLARRLLDQGCL